MKSLKVAGKTLYVFVFLFCLHVSVASGAVINGMSVRGNMDIPGGDYDRISHVRSVEQCVNYCAGDPRCRAFSYVAQSQTCWLKDRENKAVPARGIKSGNKLSPPSQPVQPDSGLRRPVADMEILHGTDLPGYDYLNFIAPNYKKCAKACKKSERCKAFTYNKVTKLCWLKYREPNPMKKRGSVSGVKNGRRTLERAR